MIKVTKDVMEKFEIENLFLSGSGEGEKWLFHLVEISSKSWICQLDTPCYLSEVTCNIKIKGEYSKVNSEISLLENNIYRLEPKNISSSNDLVRLYKKIRKLERNTAFLEKRKENRYEVGIKGSELFGLCENEKQKVIFENTELPCFFNNISYSGCNITTLQTDSLKFKLGNEIFFRLNFVNPIEQVFLQGKICSVALKSPEDSIHYKFGILSVELYEPPLSWKNRLTEYIRKMEK